VLVMALGRWVAFSPQVVKLVRNWVDGGGGVFLLGFYLADSHHKEANPSALGRALGFSFRDDIVMPPGRTSYGECQEQGFDANGKFAVSAQVPVGDDHPISRNVREVAVLSACSIDPYNVPEYEIRIRAGSAVVVELKTRLDADGRRLQILDYIPTSRTEPTVLAAWQYGKGRVVASGTWKLFTLDQCDNIRLVENAIAWLGTQATAPRGAAST
jgi:hypothetical protein